MNEYVIGIDVGGTNIKIMVMTTGLQTVGWRSIATRKQLGYDRISDNIIGTIEEIFAENGINNPMVASVTMGLPGIVDKQAHRTVHLAYLQWDGFDPCEKIGQHFDAPSFVDNDASLNALGEYRFGIQRAQQNIVLLTLGTGVGCGIIIDGRIFRGTKNLAAEIGHMTIAADSPEKCCFCGKEGCLEAFCSGVALERYTKSRLNEYPQSILHRYVAENNGAFDNAFVTNGLGTGDELCAIIMRRYVRYLAVGVANMMKLFNPDLVLIGGGISNAGDALISPLAEKVKELVLHERQFCPIQQAKLGSKAGMYGACTLAAISVGKGDA